jgi:hypothetical protein
MLAVLEARGIPLSAAVRERIQTAKRLAGVQGWLRRAALVQSADELFHV